MVQRFGLPALELEQLKDFKSNPSACCKSWAVWGGLGTVPANTLKKSDLRKVQTISDRSRVHDLSGQARLDRRRSGRTKREARDPSQWHSRQNARPHAREVQINATLHAQIWSETPESPAISNPRACRTLRICRNPPQNSPRQPKPPSQISSKLPLWQATSVPCNGPRSFPPLRPHSRHGQTALFSPSRKTALRRSRRGDERDNSWGRIRLDHRERSVTREGRGG